MGLVEQLKKDFTISETWGPFQLRPDTPQQGIPLAALFPGIDIKERYVGLNKTGEPLGVRFSERTLLSNSRLALQAGEYARDKGKYDSFHKRVFEAYFTDLLDIGDIKILLSVAEQAGLDPRDLKICLEQNRYRTRLEVAMNEAAEIGITAVPTFILNEVHKIVGAQPLGSFRDYLRGIDQGVS